MGMVELWHRVMGGTSQPVSNTGAVLPTLEQQIEQAHREWQAAKAYFDQVTEPELVDHAIYLMEAAQRKYMYLMGKIRVEQGA